MAYGNYIASIPFGQIEQFRLRSIALFQPSKIESVSHILATWITLQPIGSLITEALDGGSKLSDDLWHPLRPPTVHYPSDVKRLHSAIADALRSIDATNPPHDGDWYRIEINKLVSVLEFAVEQSEAVVSVLHPPQDEVRAAKVYIPLATVSV